MRETKTSIAGWKLPIIRWSLRQLAPLLPLLNNKTYGTLARFGIDDMYQNPHTKDFAIYPSYEKYTPEPLNQ